MALALPSSSQPTLSRKCSTMICTFWAMLVGCSFTQFITDLIAALLSTKSLLAPPETWIVPSAAVSSVW